MLGRLFGRTKDDRDDTVCSTCGRTLLAGEWTQRVVDNDGTERFICALCARSGEVSSTAAAASMLRTPPPACTGQPTAAAIAATVARESAERMGLSKGSSAWALFKASSVILGVV